MQFRVKTGNIDVLIEAESHEQAAQAAFDASVPGSTAGLFVSTKRKGEVKYWHLSEWYIKIEDRTMVSFHSIYCPCDRCALAREKPLETDRSSAV